MCQHGNWEGFSSVELDNKNIEHNFAILEQCDMCGDYRALVVDDLRLTVESDTNWSGEEELDEDSQWSVDR